MTTTLGPLALALVGLAPPADAPSRELEPPVRLQAAGKVIDTDIGHAALASASMPSRSSQARLSVTMCARHNPTDSADGASNVMTSPATPRLATSIAAVTYGNAEAYR